MYRKSVKPQPPRQRIAAEELKELAENSPHIEIIENRKKNKPSLPANQSNVNCFEEDKRND